MAWLLEKRLLDPSMDKLEPDSWDNTHTHTQTGISNASVAPLAQPSTASHGEQHGLLQVHQVFTRMDCSTSTYTAGGREIPPRGPLGGKSRPRALWAN